jgi:hypothetical protein
VGGQAAGAPSRTELDGRVVGHGKNEADAPQIEELREAYEAWNPHDPEAETADQLAARFEISKQTMYTLRKNWMKAELEDRDATDAENVAQLHQAILFLTQELDAARARILELEQDAER